MVVANQNFVYSLAMGLGVSTVLETIKIKPLQQNECFFPRKNCQYFQCCFYTTTDLLRNEDSAILETQ